MSVTIKPESFGDLHAPKEGDKLFKDWYKRHWPLLVALLTLWAVVAGLVMPSLRPANQTGFHPPYALDDAYIHMAIAKNLAQHGIWGVTPYEFSSSASSILWPLILAITYLLSKPNEYAPFGLNLFFASLIIVAVYYSVKRYRVSPVFKLVLLLAVIFLTPLPTLIFDGMEHNLHILVLILFVGLSVNVLTSAKTTFKLTTLWLGVALLSVMVRYESLFVITVVGVLLLVRKHWGLTTILAAISSLPVIIYGLVSVANGSLWLPNSVLVKSHPLDFSFGVIFKFLGFVDFSNKDHVPMLVAPHILTLAVTALLVYRGRFNHKSFWNRGQLLLTIFLVTAFLHMQLAGISWFYRYEAYVVTLGLLAIGTALFEDWSIAKPGLKLKRRGLPVYGVNIVLVMLLWLPLVDRGIRALDLTPQATINIFEQQYQEAVFLHKYYNNAAVAANDIGAINFLTNIHCVDLSGLGTIEITKAIRDKSYNQTLVDEITRTRGVKIAIVLDGYATPPSWVAVGSWHTPNAVVLAADTIWFYALDQTEAIQLRANLQQFGASLPSDVHQMLLPITAK